MKLKHIISLSIISLILLSCIKDEALNAEADITAFILDDSENILKREPAISNNLITLDVYAHIDLRKQAPRFELTEGATIYPASGDTLDFNTPQFYTVTSEDKLWQKRYEVRFITRNITTKYSFENARYEYDGKGKEKYYIFYEKGEDGSNIMDWASGNSGFSIISLGKPPELFPTSITDKGKAGKALKLYTQETGIIGPMFGKPMAAGNLFMGEFIMPSLGGDAKKAIHLGKPLDAIPLRLTGYYKYKSGPEYKKLKEVIPGMKDTFDIYAVFFETDDETAYLDGTNQFTHRNIYSIARIAEKDRRETGLEENDWVYFEIPFILQKEKDEKENETTKDKKLNLEKLKNHKYSVSIVFSSSIKGDDFHGAIGSTLYIDEMELVIKKD